MSVVMLPSFTVVHMNVLSDEPGNRNVAPQSERMASIYDALHSAIPNGFDVLSLCEVEQVGCHDVGQRLNEQFGLSNYAVAGHKNKTDTLLLAVRKPWTKPTATILDPEYAGRGTVSTEIEELGLIARGVHISHEARKVRLKELQISRALGSVSAKSVIKRVLLMGDLNCFRRQKARRQHEKTHISVAAALGMPITFPTAKYRFRTVKLYQQPLVGRGYSLDDILIPKGEYDEDDPDTFEDEYILEDADTFEGEADHVGMWARIRKKTQNAVRQLRQPASEEDHSRYGLQEDAM